MMRALLSLLIVVAGIAAGAGAAVFLAPAQGTDVPASAVPKTTAGALASSEYVKLGRQFIIPVVSDGRTRALMLFELAVDVPAVEAARVYAKEPRLRDAFLRELFEMSHTGGFMGDYTGDRILTELRGNLTEAARQQLGDAVRDVLILDVMRQEL